MKLKSIIGILLIVISLAAMYLWETVFRDKLILTDVLAASKDIESGEIITPDCIKILSVTRDSVVKGAIKADDLASVINKESVYPFKENSQIYAGALSAGNDLNEDGTHTVYLSSDWIFEKNAELKAGDIVSIYFMPNQEFVGMYQVKCLDPEDDAFVEIQCPLTDYFKMLAALHEDKEKSLLLISERSL